MGARVWVDTDVALGDGRGDVDDGFALAAILTAARRGRTSIAGISTVCALGSRRWLARARRGLSRSFALWDLPAALDTLGMLPGAERGPRELAPGIRRYLRLSRLVPCLISFDADGARETFLSHLRGEVFAPGSLFMENGAS